MGETPNFDWTPLLTMLQEKLMQGMPLSTEERQVFDFLMTTANGGSNLYDSANFQGLRNDFLRPNLISALDNYMGMVGTVAGPELAGLLQQWGDQGVIPAATAQELMGQYQNPNFTRVGSLEQEFGNRGGIRANAGAYNALRSEAQYNMLKAILSAEGQSNTSAYDMSLRGRQQDIDAATRAGQLATAGQNRMAQLAVPSINRGGAGSGGGGGGGEPPARPPIQFPLPAVQEPPSFLDRFSPELGKFALALADRGIQAYLKRDKTTGEDNGPYSTPPTDRDEFGNRINVDDDDNRNPYALLQGDNWGMNPGIAAAYNIYRTGEREDLSNLANFNSTTGLSPNDVGGQGDMGWPQYQQPQYSYDDYYGGYNQSYQYPQQTIDNYYIPTSYSPSPSFEFDNYNYDYDYGYNNYDYQDYSGSNYYDSYSQPEYSYDYTSEYY